LPSTPCPALVVQPHSAKKPEKGIPFLGVEQLLAGCSYHHIVIASSLEVLPTLEVQGDTDSVQPQEAQQAGEGKL
jgi:hypothetical protein